MFIDTLATGIGTVGGGLMALRQFGSTSSLSVSHPSHKSPLIHLAIASTLWHGLRSVGHLSSAESNGEKAVQEWSRVLGGVRKVVIVPKGETLVIKDGNCSGVFDYAERTVLLQEGYHDPITVIFHEAMGHGIELGNQEIESLIVLTMKLDGHLLGDYAVKSTREFLSMGVERYVRHPEDRQFYPHLYELIDHLLLLEPARMPAHASRLDIVIPSLILAIFYGTSPSHSEKEGE
ncbi:MAG: hypothetical protein HYT76_08470 [Deltaproteobacteria bacterium]|nr:hypothetical protein [Deltaproteobacteria bacterium]